MIEIPDKSKTSLSKNHNFAVSTEHSSREARVRARAKEEGWTDDELQSLLDAYKEMDEFREQRAKDIASGVYVQPTYGHDDLNFFERIGHDVTEVRKALIEKENANLV